MSQYVQQNSQRYYPSTLSTNGSQGNYVLQQSHRGSVIRQSSLNRNNSIASSMTMKPSKIQENFCGKIKRDNSVRNSVDFKENDPYSKNSILSGHINKASSTLRDSMELVSEYDSKNTYCNPMIMKRERNSHEISRQKLIPIQSAVNQDNRSQDFLRKSKDSIHQQQQYESLNQRVTKLESLMKDNGTIMGLYSTKIQKLQELCGQNASQSNYKPEQQSSSTRNRHSRSITSSVTSSSPSPSFKQLSDIMSLIQQSKNYQIKNAQQYRKMIDEFRINILQFRQELNKTSKRTQLDVEINKIKEIIAGGVPINNNVNTSSLSRKSSHTEISTTSTTNTYNNLNYNSSQSPSQTLQKIQFEISTIKHALQKLEENNMSFKADLVKSNVREKKFCDEVQASLGDINKKIVTLNKEIIPFKMNDAKRGNKYQGVPVCFKVTQQLNSCIIPKPPTLSKSTHIQSSYSPEATKQSSPTTFNSSLRGSQNSNNSSSLITSSCLTSSEKLTVSTKTYYIDNQGCLLDKQGYYLLNDKSEQIKLSEKEISMLKKMNVLE